MKKILLILLLFSYAVSAKNYGFIVGISKYENIGLLKGVDNDIETYKKILNRWNIEELTVLRNKGATKKDILYKLNFISKNIKKGDNFFMFFSGHGTSLRDSAYNSALQNAGLSKKMHDSGAILPYDFDKKNIAKTIIIGKDLKKILKKIDSKINRGLIVFDACFSGNSIRDKNGRFFNQTPYILTHIDGYPYNKIDYIASSIIESKAGKFSFILNKCLDRYELNHIKSCINKEKSNFTTMIPAVIAGKAH